MKKKLMFLLFSVLIVLAGCVQNSNAPAKTGEKEGTETANGDSTEKKILTVAMTADQGTLDPAVTMDNSAWKITYPAYERLVEYDGESTEVKPGIAKEWKVSEDGKTWTFTLNEGHKFSDGTEVNAEAVKTTFERTLKIGNGPAEVYGVISEIKVESPYVVTFALKENFPPFLSTLAANYGGIVNPKVMEHEKDGDLGQNYLANNTMGSGSYELTEWKQGEYIKLSVNKEAKVQPSIEEVYFRIVADGATQRMQLEKGEIDIAEGIPTEQIESVRSMDHVELLQKPSLLVDYVYVNSSKGNEALKDPKVRQALSYGIDYNSMIDVVHQGFATPMRGPVPDGLWGHNKDAIQYELNIEKAKELLAEAGATDVTLTLLYSDNKTWWETEALTIQANLKEIGVNVELNKVAYATSREMMDKGEFDLALGVWSPDFGDPYMFMNYWYDSANFGLAGNRAFYKNDQVDTLLKQAATSNNQEEREALYFDIQDIVIEEAPYILLFQKDFTLPVSKSVQGFVYNPMLEGIYNLAEMNKQ
ncbi:ABC transporter substrate-binding protein [Bacillus sp. JJ1532]|uniref:ABC transporter substrate-binding protein n=1 Tax=Bacillus sp. JJ1532 TaxID=3122958 RepID=UPI003000A84D